MTPNLVNRFIYRIKRFINKRWIVWKDTDGSPCPICQSSMTKRVGRNILHDGGVSYVNECSDCSHKFCVNLPSLSVIQSWYQGLSYFNRNCSYQGIKSLELSSQWDDFINSRQKIFDSHITPKFEVGKSLRVVEIGCLEGSFLKHLSNQGHQVIGLEVNSEVATAGREKYGIDVRCCNIELEAPQLEVDAVLSFHMFEHLIDPLGATKKVRQMLVRGGIALFEVPCDDNEMNNPDHFHFFTPQSARRMMETYFSDVGVVPNSYMRCGKVELGSLYVIGRVP